jgi:hemerythrin
MQQTGQEVSASVALTEQAGESFETIAANATTVNAQSQAAQSALAAMEAASLKLEQVMTEVKQIAEQNRAGAAQMATLNGRAVESLDTVSAVVEENTASMEEMAASSGEVTQAIESIASVLEENSASVEEVSASAEELNAQVEEVSASAQSLAEMAQALQAIVAQFKLADGQRLEAVMVNGTSNGQPQPRPRPVIVRPVAPRQPSAPALTRRVAAPAVATSRPAAVAGTDAFVWDESLATGDAKVDEQHRELIRQINVLLRAMSEGHGRQEIKKILDFLSDYVIHHFHWEETCMEKHRCPLAAVNQRAHTTFVERFQAICLRYETEGPSADLVLQIRRELGDWLVNHIRKIDTSLRGCVKH